MRRTPKRTKSRRPGILCPTCGNAVSQVMRTTARGDGLQRVRECAKCHRKFLTREATAKSDTGVTSLAIGVTSLIHALGLSPKSYLPHDPVR